MKVVLVLMLKVPGEPAGSRIVNSVAEGWRSTTRSPSVLSGKTLAKLDVRCAERVSAETISSSRCSVQGRSTPPDQMSLSSTVTRVIERNACTGATTK